MIYQPPTPPNNQINQNTDQNPSMRDRQKQIGNRVNPDGQDVTQPRLAQQQRPRMNDQKSTISGTKPAKSSAKKWIIGIIGGSAATGGLVGWLIN